MFHDVEASVISGLVLAVIIAIAGIVLRWFRQLRKLIVWTSKQVANDGNGSWRSNVDQRLTAIEEALPGVKPSPEPISKPPLEK